MEQMVSIYRVLIPIHLPRAKRKSKDIEFGEGVKRLVCSACLCIAPMISPGTDDIKCYYVFILFIFLTRFSMYTNAPSKNNNK